MIIRKYFIIPLFLLCFAFANSQSYTSEKALFSLTPEEKAWLEAHPSIRVAADTRWAPVEFVDEDEEFKGISIDYLKRLSEILSVEFQFKENVTWQLP